MPGYATRLQLACSTAVMLVGPVRTYPKAQRLAIIEAIEYNERRCAKYRKPGYDVGSTSLSVYSERR